MLAGVKDYATDAMPGELLGTRQSSNTTTNNGNMRITREWMLPCQLLGLVNLLPDDSSMAAQIKRFMKVIMAAKRPENGAPVPAVPVFWRSN